MITLNNLLEQIADVQMGIVLSATRYMRFRLLNAPHGILVFEMKLLWRRTHRYNRLIKRLSDRHTAFYIGPLATPWRPKP